MESPTHAAPRASIGLSGRTDPPGVVSLPAWSAWLAPPVVGGGVVSVVIPPCRVGSDSQPVGSRE